MEGRREKEEVDGVSNGRGDREDWRHERRGIRREREKEREREGGRERGRERGERGREKERELGSSLRYSGRKQKRRGLIREERERRTDGRTAAERDGLRYRSTVKWG